MISFQICAFKWLPGYVLADIKTGDMRALQSEANTQRWVDADERQNMQYSVIIGLLNLSNPSSKKCLRSL